MPPIADSSANGPFNGGCMHDGLAYPDHKLLCIEGTEGTRDLVCVNTEIHSTSVEKVKVPWVDLEACVMTEVVGAPESGELISVEGESAVDPSVVDELPDVDVKGECEIHPACSH